jgi:hypothetical protein
MTLLAHPGHWITSVAYFLPVLVFIAWLVVVQVRERRSGGEGEDAAER